MVEDTKTKHSRIHSMRSIKLNKVALNSIFILALLILGAVSLISYLELKNLKESNRSVVQNYSVLNTLDETLNGMTDLESDQRGYLITNDKTYLKNMDTSKAQLSNSLEKLSELTQDNDEQNLRVQNYANTIKTSLALLFEVANVKSRAEFNTPEGIALFNKSSAMSDRVKALAQEIKSVELVLLHDRNKALLTNANTSSFIIILVSLVSLILLIVPFILANFELINRQIIEHKNRKIRVHLQQIIESKSEMIATMDEKKRFLMFNESYQREFMRLFNQSLVTGMYLEEAFSNASSANAELVRLWKGSMVRQDLPQRVDMRQFDNSNQIFEFSSKQIVNENKELKGIVHKVLNITDKVAGRIGPRDFSLVPKTPSKTRRAVFPQRASQSRFTSIA